MSIPVAGIRGLMSAAVIIVAWAACLGIQLTQAWPPSGLPIWLPLGFVVQTFLFTGLFITAHDAMHGTLHPSRPRLNHALGRLCVTLYAGFSYDRMRRNHLAHHAYPGEPGDDPDYHDGQHTGPIAWYFTFMARYISLRPLLVQAALFEGLTTGLGLPGPQVLLCQAAPAVMSSLQLFFFGTWLPHRAPADARTGRHVIQSTDLPGWLSFLTCFHFGYHKEHHDVPRAAWWQLPAVRRAAESKRVLLHQ